MTKNNDKHCLGQQREAQQWPDSKHPKEAQVFLLRLFNSGVDTLYHYINTGVDIENTDVENSDIENTGVDIENKRCSAGCLCPGAAHR